MYYSSAEYIICIYRYRRLLSCFQIWTTDADYVWRTYRYPQARQQRGRSRSRGYVYPHTRLPPSFGGRAEIIIGANLLSAQLYYYVARTTVLG